MLMTGAQLLPPGAGLYLAKWQHQLSLQYDQLRGIGLR